MAEFPEARRIANMVDQEKQPTREDKKALKKQLKRQSKGKWKEKMLPDPDNLEKANNRTETVDPIALIFTLISGSTMDQYQKENVS